MPAAKPSKASIQYIIEAMKACGLKPGTVHVDGSGGFRVEALVEADAVSVASDRQAANVNALTWEEVA
jgi:hypothetical protein